MTKDIDDKLALGQREDAPGTTTRQGGQPIASENISITAGPQGPNVLNDLQLIEKLQSFNRERVPERNPHERPRRIR